MLQFDHRDPSSKVATVRHLAAYGWPRMMAEVEKCDVVCANCHAARTHERLLPPPPALNL